MKIKWNGRALECEARGGLTRFELRNGGELRIGQRGIYLVAELSIRNGLVSTRLMSGTTEQAAADELLALAKGIFES